MNDDRAAVNGMDKTIVGITSAMYNVVSDDRLRPDVRVHFVLTAHRTCVSLMRLCDKMSEALTEAKR